MRSPKESVGEAKLKFDLFVAANLRESQSQQQRFESKGGVGMSAAALDNFGTALHAVADSMSPAHGGFQVWKLSDIRSHVNAESSIAPEQEAAAVEAARALYGEAFGAARLNQATANRDEEQEKEDER